MQFNAGAQFEIALKRQQKVVSIAFPDDVQFADRQRKIKTITKRLGPGRTQTTSEGIEEADAALLALIRLDKDAPGPEFSPAEASVIISRILKAEPGEAERVGQDKHLIPLEIVNGIKTEHLLRDPSEAELRKFNKAAYGFIDLRRGNQLLKISVPAMVEFYDKLAEGTGYAVGYDGAVPAAHKMAVIMELTDVMALEDAEAEEDPETNF